MNATIAKPAGTGTIQNDDGAAIASTSTATAARIIEDRSVKISPNPASSIMRVELPGYTGNITLQLINLQGKMMLQKKVEVKTHFANEQMDVSSFASGTYLLLVVDDKGNRETKRVVISH